MFMCLCTTPECALLEILDYADLCNKWTVSNDMSRVVTEGTSSIWAVSGKVAEMFAEGKIILEATVLRI